MLSSYMHCCTRPTILLRPTHVICKEDGIPFGKLLRQSFEEGQRAFRAGREMIEPGAQELYEEARASGLAGNLGDLKTQLTKMTEVSPQQLVSDLCRSIVLSILFSRPATSPLWSSEHGSRRQALKRQGQFCDDNGTLLSRSHTRMPPSCRGLAASAGSERSAR